jgi:hypothetical protein
VRKRDAIPSVVYRLPLCPCCDNEVKLEEDKYLCTLCSMQWFANFDESNGAADPDLPQCEATIQPFRNTGEPKLRDRVYRCVKNEHPESDMHLGIKSGTDVNLWDHYPWLGSMKSAIEARRTK